ncbi:MAG: transposase, partial [Pseudomonadota bacterium]
TIFFEKSDFQNYLDILQEQCERFSVKILSYCLLPNQVHLLAIPQNGELLARAIGETHRRYTNMINKRNNWRGHLFQDRFFSYVCDEQYSLRAMRFIETMPLISKITPKPESYLWSSARDRIKVTKESFITNPSNFHAIQDWPAFLARPMDEQELKKIQTHLQTGRPRGNDAFLDMIEEKIGRSVRPQKRGRKPKMKAEAFRDNTILRAIAR